MKMLSYGIAAIAVLILIGFVYMTGEQKEAHRLWGVSLEIAVRAGDLGRAESLFAEEGHTPQRASLDQMSADLAANNYAFGKIVSLGRSYEAGERDGEGYCDLSQRMNREVRNDTRYRFPKSLQQFVTERCDGIGEEKRLAALAVMEAETSARDGKEAEGALVAAARIDRGSAAWKQKEAERLAASQARKAARTAKEAEVKAQRAKATEIENARLKEVGVAGFFSSRLADTILALQNREITPADVGGRVFGCGQIVNALRESCHYRDKKVQAVQVMEDESVLYELDELRGSTNYEFTILVRDSIEPAQTRIGVPLPPGYYKLDGTHAYETVSGAINTILVIQRIE